jgi:predicted nuclease of predicted toxin-antitoxin system
VARVLLDECVPARLARGLIGHEITTVVKMRWAGTKDGALLARAAAEFEVLVTLDRSLPRQQPIQNLQIFVIVLSAGKNRLRDLEPLVPSLLTLLADPAPGTVRFIAG